MARPGIEPRSPSYMADALTAELLTKPAAKTVSDTNIAEIVHRLGWMNLGHDYNELLNPLSRVLTRFGNGVEDVSDWFCKFNLKFFLQFRDRRAIGFSFGKNSVCFKCFKNWNISLNIDIIDFILNPSW